MTNGIVKQSRGPHYGEVENHFDFDQAYRYISENPDRQYQTTGNKSLFTAEATTAKKGKHAGERVIIFRSEGKEYARTYECCWGHVTNCNRTYIDCYTQAIGPG